MGFEQSGYSITKLIVSKWGKHIGLAPMTDGTFELYNKKNEFLGRIIYNKQWKCLVWLQEEGIVMSKDCLDECFLFAEEYRKEELNTEGNK